MKALFRPGDWRGTERIILLISWNKEDKFEISNFLFQRGTCAIQMSKNGGTHGKNCKKHTALITYRNDY